ncbi:hypothetical protein BDP27DRAFT_1424522 [Rhodocollybia butyracea]|uniref:Uncharacterized protein n=1 Tax=Rhodocollybia butyracea TaxID=206335 RepID=A0A9P5U4L1_9AGAR|nr:hypothetical protein BDP27DRAFT_1424522 [Rhodocollybia butyracea]
MASIRAYYLPAETASDIDASQPVSVEQLDTLGWKISSVGESLDEIEQASRKIAQELGFPITEEGCIVPFSFDLGRNAATMDPEMAALLRKLAEVENSDICFENGVIVVVTSGNHYIDVEDVTTGGWIRIHSGGGMLYRVPTGAKYRVAFNEQNRGIVGIAFLKETISNHGLLLEKEIDDHPARQVYLKEVLKKS